MVKTISYGRLKHNNFIGTIKYDEENNYWSGKILHIEKLIFYESESRAGLYEAFVDAVEEYQNRKKSK